MRTDRRGTPDVSGSQALARAVRAMMRPLVRLLLEKQLGYPFLSNLLKRLYVEVAERDVAIPGRRPTDSRISLLTGIHRAEVKRIREAFGEDEGIPSTASLGALVVSRWIADPTFLEADGRPRALPRRAPEGAPSFESLVGSVSRDIPPRSVLDEWLRLGVVGEDGSGLIRLAADSFVPAKGFEEKAHFFGRNLRDHIAAGAHNLLEEGPPFFERSVYYDRLSRRSVEELERMARDEGAELIRRVNRRALELQSADAGAEGEGVSHRMTLGAYFYRALDELDGVERYGEDDHAD